MKIVDYFSCDDKLHRLEQIEKADWSAAAFLVELLRENRLEQVCGKTRLLLLIDGNELVSFCTLSEQDEVAAPEMSPWIGFVFTFPLYRGKGCAGELIAFACAEAKKMSAREVYVSTDATGLYERYGFEYLKNMKTVFGEESRIYKRKIGDI